MTAIVRVKLTLDAFPVPVRSAAVDRATLDALKAESPADGAKLERALVLRGQGALEADRFRDGDERREGDVVYPSDFADWKPSAEVTVRASAWLASPQVRADVEVVVGTWSKKLSVVGHRVLVDRVAGGKASDPQAFTRIAIDYAHAHGGPGYANNPIGKGFLGHVEDDRDLYQPPRSERSRVMPSQQLPNVEHARGKAEQGGLPAGFGPINPAWAFRAQKRGKQYDERWLAERAPAPPADFDPTFFFAALPDQILPGFLRGDETVRLKNLVEASSDVRLTLPGLRPRVFVRDTGGKDVEVTMNADTLHLDLEEGALYLTWRGLVPAKDIELSDKAFALVVVEPLGEAKPASAHLADLDVFANDPTGVERALPTGARAAADQMKKLREADEAELDRMLANGPNAMDALLAHLGPAMEGARAQGKAAFQAANDALGADAYREKVKRGIRQGEGGQSASDAPAKTIARRGVAAAESIGEQTGPSPEIDASIATLKSVEAKSAATDGPSFVGEDLTDRDFAGQDLTGASFDGAVLDRTNLRGAKLVRASFRGASFHMTDLTGADLSDADLSQATLHRVTAEKAVFARARLDMVRIRVSKLSGADLSGAKGMMLHVSESDLASAKANGLEVERATFDGCRLEGADLSSARLVATRFRNCVAPDIDLHAAELTQTGFKSSDLSRASAKSVHGEQTVWLETTLEDSDFSGAVLPLGFFHGAKAARASFQRADLAGARFDKAELDGAHFEKASLHSASLSQASLRRTSFAEASLFRTVFTDTSTASCDMRGAALEGSVTGFAPQGEKK